MPQTLQADSKTRKLVNLRRAIFKRTNDSNTISARSQRFYRASRAKTIWSNGMERARNRWGKALRSKKARRETSFDSMYPVGEIASHLPEFIPEPPHVFGAAEDSISVQSPLSVQYIGHRQSQAPSVTVTHPTPSNSRRHQGYRQSQFTIHNPDAASPGTPSTARTVSREIDPTAVSDDLFTRSIPNIHSNNSSSVNSSILSTPHAGHVPGQVNPAAVAQNRPSDVRAQASNDMLDDSLGSDRDQPPSQQEQGSKATRPFSVPAQTGRRSTPASTEPRPLTTHFEVPQLPPFALPPNLEKLRQSIYEITGAPETSSIQDAMAALTGDCETDAKACAISDAEIYKLVAHGQTSKYPGQPIPYTKFQAVQPGKNQKAIPVQATGNGHPRPTTPLTPPRTSKGKQAADPAIQKHLDEIRKKKIDRKHKNLSMMFDGANFDDTPSTSSGLDDDDPNWTTFPDPDKKPSLPKQERPQTSEIRCYPLPIKHKPVAKQPSTRKPNREKSLPDLPPEALAKPHHLHVPHCPDCPQGVPSLSYPPTPPRAHRLPLRPAASAR